MTLTAALVRRAHGPAEKSADEAAASCGRMLRPLASALGVRLGLILAALTLLGLLAAPLLAALLAPGFSGPEAARVAELLRMEENKPLTPDDLPKMDGTLWAWPFCTVWMCSGCPPCRRRCSI
jgi:hypothetical protein